MQPSFVYDGVKIFATRQRNVVSADARIISIPPERELPLLRHFSALDKDTEDEFLGVSRSFLHPRLTVTKEQLENFLHTAGSKFNPRLNDFDTVISKLLSFLEMALEKNIAVPWIEYNSDPGRWHAEIAFMVSLEQKSLLGLTAQDSVGTQGGMLITDDLKPFIHQEPRGSGDPADRMIMNIIQGVVPPQTDIVTVNLLYEPEIFKTTLLSLYTSDGRFSPPFPNAAQQCAEEYNYNKTWWDRHAFFR